MMKRLVGMVGTALACGSAAAQEARPVGDALARKYADLEASAPHLSAFRGGVNLVPTFIVIGLVLAALYIIIHFTRAGK